jgi:PPOX class probable F420-dependent enzyme
MELADALEFAKTTRHGTLVTIRGNGRPQLSNISYTVSTDGLIRISITADRAKYRNLLREGWAALHVSGPGFGSYAVIEGQVTLSEVAAAADDAAVDELVDVYRSIAGEHGDWDDYRQAMVRDKRVVVRIAPDRAYGMLAN